MSADKPEKASASLCDIKHIIRHKLVRSHFQSIIDLKTSRSLGFEALVRTSSQIAAVSPDEMFTEAQKESCASSLDTLCLFTALSSSRSRQLEGLIFINVLPQNLAMLAKTFAHTTGFNSLEGVVLEISERYPLENFDELNQHLQDLRRCGAKIAIDDLGAGYAGLKSWSQIQPDFVKIDRHFIHKVDSDNIKREFVRSILETARGMGCQVIAEGIETRLELEVLFSMGITIGQGYLLHRPEPAPNLTLIKEELNNQPPVNRDLLFVRPAERVSSIRHSCQAVESKMLIKDLYQLFESKPELHSLPVLNCCEPVGIISRIDLMMAWSRPNFSGSRDSMHVAAIMDRAPIIVDIRDDLESVSQLVTTKAHSDLNHGFIIADKGQYVGMGSVTELLKAITQNKNNRDRYSNPLTHLPGVVPVGEWLEELMKHKEEISLAYIGLSNFKQYNDCHGYSKGDDLIKLVADTLVSNTLKNQELVGHFGADNFVIIFRNNDWQHRCQMMLEDFKSILASNLSDEERTTGKMQISKPPVVLDTDLEQSFDIPSMAIGVAMPKSDKPIPYDDLVELANYAKRKAMQKSDNHFFIAKVAQLPN